jgi:hypothetical protein
MAERTVVCVLGMHRSGTSLVTRMLNLLGVYLGPEEKLMHPGPDNPVGFWEHEEFVAMNKEILSRYGGSWDEPPDFQPGWESSPRLSDLRGAALELVAREFGRSELWGWKDPRNSVTLPFWQLLVPGMRYVVCVRNPLDVARSLAHRDGFSPEKAGNLWVAHVEASLMNTAGQDRLILFYEDVMTDWPEELSRLSSLMGEPDAAAFDHVRTAVWGEVHEELHHHRASTWDVVTGPELPVRAKALHLVLREGLEGPGIEEFSRSSRSARRALRAARALVGTEPARQSV